MKGFVADLLHGGAEPSTARARQLGVRRFSAWLAEEGEIDDGPLLGLKAPKLDAKVTDSLTEAELRRLIKACGGTEFRDRRDEAIVRLMAENRDARRRADRVDGRRRSFGPRSGNRAPRQRRQGACGPDCRWASCEFTAPAES